MTSPSTDRRLGLASGTAIKTPVDCATTANITLSGEQTIDGVTTNSSRVLVKNQTTGSENGIWRSNTGAWTREPDADGTNDLVCGTLVGIAGGAQAFGIYQITTTGAITPGTTSITFAVALTSQAVSAYMQTLLAAANAAAARTLLGVAPRATRIDVASATTTDITTNAPNTDDIRLTGTATITSFTIATDRVLRVIANGAFTLTNNSNIVTNTSANIVAAAGDTFILRATAADTVEVLNYVRISSLSTSSAQQIQTIPTPTLSGGAMTIPAPSSNFSLDFRNSALGSGTVTTVSGAPAALTLPSGASLGSTSAVQSDIALLIINNSGTLEYAVVNLSGGTDLSETGVISTTAISAASTSASVVYSTTARSNVAYRVIGLYRSTQATAGTWATSPSLIQGMGGNAYKALPISSMVRLNTANGYGSTNTKIRRFTNTVTNQGTDITYADSATLGASFTINTNGVYAISYSDNFNATGTAGLTKDTATPTTNVYSCAAAEVIAMATTGSGNWLGCAAATLYLTAGTVVRPHTDGAASGIYAAQFVISRVS